MQDLQPDEWDSLLHRSSYWRMIRVTAWILRFVNNCLARGRHNRRRSGPLVSEEVEAATNRWVRRVQRGVNPDLQAPGTSQYI